MLDRPNPIDGVTVEGPLLDKGQESFVGLQRLPMRHGMTVGELAKMFAKERNIDAKLTVVTGGRLAARTCTCSTRACRG